MHIKHFWILPDVKNITSCLAGSLRKFNRYSLEMFSTEEKPLEEGPVTAMSSDKVLTPLYDNKDRNKREIYILLKWSIHKV